MLATLVFLTLDVPHPDATLVPTLDLAKITWLDARSLNGRRVRVRADFPVWALPCDFGEGFVREAAGPKDESRSVHFAKGEQPDWLADALTVEGWVKVVWHKAATREGRPVAAFVEVQIVGARVVK